MTFRDEIRPVIAKILAEKEYNMKKLILVQEQYCYKRGGYAKVIWYNELYKQQSGSQPKEKKEKKKKIKENFKIVVTCPHEIRNLKNRAYHLLQQNINLGYPIILKKIGGRAFCSPQYFELFRAETAKFIQHNKHTQDDSKRI